MAKSNLPHYNLERPFNVQYGVVIAWKVDLILYKPYLDQFIFMISISK